MIIKNITKTEILAEETDRRVRLLESKSSEKENVKTLTDKGKFKVVNSNTTSKYVDFYCKEQTGVVLNLSVLTAPLANFQLRVLLNGKVTTQYPKETALNKQLFMVAQKGKNNLELRFKFTLDGEYTIADFEFGLVGDFYEEELISRVDLLNQNCIVFKNGDGVNFLNAENLEIEHSLIGVKDFSCAYLSGDKILLLKKDFNLLSNLYVYKKDDYSIESQTALNENYSGCTMRKVGDFYALYFLKGNFIYERYYTQESTYSQTKLPIRAKNISVYSGNVNDYFYYTDLFGNFVVSVIKKDEPFKIVQNYTFGKVKNPKIYENNSICYLSYKCGQLVVERQLKSSTKLTILGVGDEGFKMANGKVVLRNKNQIELI